MKAKTPYKVLKLEKDYTRETLDAVLAGRGHPPARSFPVLFNEDELIGGLNEGKMALAKGEL
jgi:glutaredoxin